MNRRLKAFSIIHSMIIICLMFCNGGTGTNSFQKSAGYLCKELQCGCKLSPDCKRNCCCTFTGKQGTFLTGDKQKDVFQVFMSSINCKYGNDPLTGITFTGKYILDEQVRPIKKSFLCFLPPETSIYLPEVFISPPKKPPRFFV